MSQSELPDAAKPLKFGGIDQLDKQPAFWAVCVDADYIMDRIPVDPF
jgi:hypothetical protein